MGLFVVLRVHEAVVVAILVEKFHGDFIHGDLFNGIAGAEAMLKHGPSADVAQLGLDESAQIAGRTVLYCKDQMKIIVVLNDHPRTHLGCWNRHELNSLLETIADLVSLACFIAGHGETGGQAYRDQEADRRTRNFTSNRHESQPTGLNSS